MRFAIFVILTRAGEVVYEKEHAFQPLQSEMEHLVIEHDADYLKLEHRYIYVPPADEEVAVVGTEVSND